MLSEVRIILLFVLLAPCANAGPWHFVRTHKTVLLEDAVTVGAAAAESYTSVQCLRDMRLAGVTTSTCSKQGWFMLELSPAFVAANHAAYHYAPTKEAKYLAPLSWNVPLTTVNLDATVTNIKDSSVGYLRETWRLPSHVR